MNHLTFGLTGVGLLLNFMVNAQQLTLSPAQPRAGKSLELHYDPTGSNLTREDPVACEVVIYQNYHWKKMTIPLSYQKNQWVGHYVVPVASPFIALRFYQGDMHQSDKIDAQLRYGFKTINDAGHPLPGGQLAQVIFQMPALDQTMPAYWTTLPEPLSTEVLSQTIKSELSTSDQIRRAVIPYLALQRATLGTGFTPAASALLERLKKLPALTESERMTIARAYRLDLNDSVRANQIERDVVRGNPQGETARLLAFQTTLGATSIADRITRSTAFLARFPYASWRAKPNGQGFIYYTVQRSLATAYFDSRQFDKIVAMLAPLDFRTSNEIARWNVGRAYNFKTVSTDSLLILSKRLIDNLIAKKDDDSYVEALVFSPEQAKKQATTQLDERLYTHISLLSDMGKIQDATHYFKNLSPTGRYGNAEFNEIYLNVLEKTRADTQPFLENCARVNALTPVMIGKLKADYTRKSAQAEGFDQYLVSLKAAAVTEIQTYVKEHLLSHELMPFTLENPQSELVRSSDWEGKIVVLDFWATWCKPCIAAFPGMQLLVDKYAADSTVAIYFVGTQQSSDYKQKSEGYIKRMGYRFNLLHDGINKKTGDQDAVFSTIAPIFHSSGIPRKIVMKDGIIRYSSEGYSGSPSQLVDELSCVIDLLKAEK